MRFITLINKKKCPEKVPKHLLAIQISQTLLYMSLLPYPTDVSTDVLTALPGMKINALWHPDGAVA